MTYILLGLDFRNNYFKYKVNRIIKQSKSFYKKLTTIIMFKMNMWTFV